MRLRSAIVSALSAIAAALLLTSCSTAPNKAAAHYTAPSVAPVTKPIAQAQGSNGEAIRKAANLTAAIERAQTIVASKSDPAAMLRDLSVALVDAHKQIDGLTGELLETQAALAEATDHAIALEAQIAVVTAAGNRALDESNTLRNDLAKLQAARAHDAVKYHRLKFGVCTLAGLLALALVVYFHLLVIVPPPYNFIALGAVPVLVFGALWLRL